MDHGILNTPLRSRGDIDAQIDRYKANLASEAKAAARTKAAQLKADRLVAHTLLDNAAAERLQEISLRVAMSVPALRKHLRGECHWQPWLVIGLLQPAA